MVSGHYPPAKPPQARGRHRIRCPRLGFQYIRSSPPYLEVASSIRNLRSVPAILTRD